MRIVRVTAQRLPLALLRPFTIAVGTLSEVRNTAVVLELSDGQLGLGEVPWLPPVTRTTPEDAEIGIGLAEQRWAGTDPRRWATRFDEVADFPSELRAGLHMALLDALTRSSRLPLWSWFGGRGTSVRTDITIPICEPAEAAVLARRYAELGYQTLKIKVGGDVGTDIARVRGTREGHPGSQLVLDANQGWTRLEAFHALSELQAAGCSPRILEQPVHRDDVDGMTQLTRESGVLIAADESCRCAEDAAAIIAGRSAHLLNIKLAKVGVDGAMSIAAMARASGLGLMFGAMVETRIGIGFAAHMAAGLGGFDLVDLDTPALLASDPTIGGHRLDGDRLELGEAWGNACISLR